MPKLPENNVYIFWTHAKVAEFGELTIVIKATNRQEAIEKCQKWCQENYHDMLEAGTQLRDVRQADGFPLIS